MTHLLQPNPGFNWMLVQWSGPDEVMADECSYCGEPIGEDEVPLRMWNAEYLVSAILHALHGGVVRVPVLHRGLRRRGRRLMAYQITDAIAKKLEAAGACVTSAGVIIVDSQKFVASYTELLLEIARLENELKRRASE